MDLRPVGDHIIVQLPEQEEVRDSGLVLPANARQKPDDAVVLAIGPKVEEVQVGDEVVFSKFAGLEVVRGEVSYHVLRPADIIAVVVPAAELPAPILEPEPEEVEA